MRSRYKSEILVSTRFASSNFTGMLVPRFWLGIYSIVTSISKMCLHKMCATFIHNKSNNYIFHTISNQYQFILDVLLFSQQNLLNRKHTSLIYDILKTKEMSIFYRPKLRYDWKWLFSCRTILYKVRVLFIITYFFP